jgi:hypothetical protein
MLMPDPQTTPSDNLKPSPVMGLDKPFTGDEPKKDGVDPETGLFHGIDPETKERVSVTLAGLQAQFGKEKGEQIYLKIAGIGGGSVFFNARAEATDFRPTLGISGLRTSLQDLQEHLGLENGQKRFELNQKYIAQVESILTGKE